MNQKKSLKLLIPILSVTIGMLFGALIMLCLLYTSDAADDIALV